MFRKNDKDAVILKENIDQPFITQLEQRNENLRFARIDSELADEIGINMHTVNKAYSLLREQGFVKVDRRKGAVISVDDNRDRAIETIKKEIVPILAESYCRGVPRETVHELVDQIYNAYEGYGTADNPKA